MPSRSDFTRVPPSVSFPDLENGVLELWDRLDAFAESVRIRPRDQEYVFYDGPPFPTGSPHFGTLLASVIKDMVPRYWTMRGYRVERRFGWDTHGLPIEMQVERHLGISGPKEIADYGIDRFNEACRALVTTNTETWSRVIRRVGRWVDMDDDYKTMDTPYMESVWWVFRQLWDKGLVYRDFKVMPYSWGAATPLSNFEANLDYRDTDDPSITVKLEVIESSGPVTAGDWLLVWTTTPWTLPGNLAVSVGPEIEYVRIDEGDNRYWIAAARVANYWKEPPSAAARAMGSELVGIEYVPPFDYFGEERDRGAFRVLASEFVTIDDGTGLVHMAPAYGEADYLTLQAAGLNALVDPIDAQGRFTEAVPEAAGLNIKDADPILIGLLKEGGRLYRHDRIRHSYPFCYRTGTPLMYKAIPSWFVRVEQIKEELVAHNETIHWVPDHVGHRRFGNWLESARDWAVSRNRYWGSCIPIWECPNGHQVCLGSIDELAERSGVRLTDLHKHIVDPVTFPCEECGATMTRVPEVLDSWFEAGSMPYGQLHYPFENRERFEDTYPAQFIAEGLDQTRGWFYTLHVLAVALFGSPAFRNCVVNGMVLDASGRKLSKSLGNYTDPEEILEEQGADALRAFLVNSPVLRAEPLRFNNDGVREVVRTVLLPLWNTYSFFTTYAEADGVTAADLAAAPPVDARPELDRWIVSVLQGLVANVNQQMEGYYLFNVVPPILGFVEDLTNWYVRRSRRRFWRTRETDDLDKLSAFATLYEVLRSFVTVLAPVLPFISEHIYQDLVVRLDPTAPASVHHCLFPVADEEVIDRDLEASMATVRAVVGLGHGLRKQHQLKVRRPLKSVTVITHDEAQRQAVKDHTELIMDELNVRSVEVVAAGEGLVELSAKPDFRKLGPRLGARMGQVAAAIEGLDNDQIDYLAGGGGLDLAGTTITGADLIIQRNPAPGTLVESAGQLTVALDITTDPSLEAEGLAREVVSRIQLLRREAGLAVTDRIQVVWSTEDQRLADAIVEHSGFIKSEVLAVAFERTSNDGSTLLDIDGVALGLGIDKV
ncbi:MAG TPA: isoleucine--tRNA ligase [Acidimicrobiia bacterium]|nr:isoleucine--tRNA ligase [Acidimicrobiia bacterium]